MELETALNEERRLGELGRETTKEILGQIATTRKMIEKQDRKINSLKKEIEAIKENVPQLKTKKIIEEKKFELQKEAETRRNEQEQWNRLVDVAKGIGWIYEKWKESQEDE